MENKQKARRVHLIYEGFNEPHWGHDFIIPPVAPRSQIQSTYRKTLELSFVVSLVICLIALNIANPLTKAEAPENLAMKIELEEIDLTQQTKRPPLPARPAMPIESDDEDLLSDETIADTEIDFEDIPAPPPAPVSNEPPPPDFFIAYDTEPKLIGGFAFIRDNLEYPIAALRAGFEGKVLVKVFIDDKGNVVAAEAMQVQGYEGFGEAAVEVVLRSKWKPAKQRDRNVPVQIVIPIIFQLNS